MVAIVDYGVGNLFSLRSSLDAVGAEATITGDASKLCDADRIILPGVGAFADAAEKLHKSGLADVLRREAGKGKPLMGICLGMQLLFDMSTEYGNHEGLGLIPGTIRPIADIIPQDYKIPHIGWNSLQLTSPNHPLFRNIRQNEYVYFVHSYYADCKDHVIATAEYGAPVTAAVAFNNVCGCQFHPEKSGDTGLRILRAFCEEDF